METFKLPEVLVFLIIFKAWQLMNKLEEKLQLAIEIDFFQEIHILYTDKHSVKYYLLRFRKS